MRQFILNLTKCIIALIFFGWISIVDVYAETKIFYCSPSGNDSNPGTETQPFSLEKAKQTAKELENSDDVTIILRGGTYTITNTVNFTASDWNGTHALTFKSYPGEIPVLSGGKTVTGWTSKGAGTWEADATPYLDKNNEVRQLFQNGERVKKTRFPYYTDTNFLTFAAISADGKTLSMNKALPEKLGTHAELVTLMNFMPSIVPIKTYSSYQIILKHQIQWDAGWTIPPVANKTPAFIENIALEASGDQGPIWEFDKENKKIRIRLSSAANPSSYTYVIPMLDEMIHIDGAANITFDGLTLQYVRGFQMPTYVKGTVSNIAFDCDGICFYMFQSGYYPLIKDNVVIWSFMPSAFFMENTKNITIKNSVFQNIGGTGITIGTKNNSYITIDRNTITDVGANCINLGDPNGHMVVNPNFSKEIIISNNTISKCGAITLGNVAIWQGFTRNTQIANNMIRDLPYTGISFGWSWGKRDETAYTNKWNDIRFNIITDICKTLIDCGAIYTIGANQASYIRGNVISHVQVQPSFYWAPINMGLYFDNASAGFTVWDNVVYDIANPAYYMWFQTAAGPSEARKQDFVINTNYLGINPSSNAAAAAILKNAGPQAGSLPTPTPTTKPAATPTPTATPIPTNTPTITPTKIPTVTLSPTQMLTGTPMLKKGDFNNDSKIDIFDYNILLSTFGKPTTQYDLTGDGKVDIFDYNVFLSLFGK